jgi:hypothetical protein
MKDAIRKSSTDITALMEMMKRLKRLPGLQMNLPTVSGWHRFCHRDNGITVLNSLRLLICYLHVELSFRACSCFIFK